MNNSNSPTSNQSIAMQRSQALVESYQNIVESAPPAPETQSNHPAIAILLDLTVGDSNQYHGQAFVSPTLKKHSDTTHRMAVLANLINVLTAVPAFYFGFLNLGLFGFVLTATLSAAALKFSNDSAAAAAASTKGNRLWSNQGLLLFVAMNVILTLMSGTGSELLTNRSTLSNRYAEELVNQQLKQSEPQAPAMTLYEQANSKCNALEEQMKQYPPESDTYESLLVQARGKYSDWNKDWTKAERSSIPPCVLKDMKSSDSAWVQYQQLRSQWTLPQQRNELGNDLQLLKQELPHIYEKNFDNSGKILSGQEEFRVAFESFWGRLLKLDFQTISQLGFSLFIFGLSVITSVGACIALVTHTCRNDTQLSFNTDVRRAILEHLAYLAKPPQIPAPPTPAITSPISYFPTPTNPSVEPPISFQHPASHPLPKNEPLPQPEKPLSQFPNGFIPAED
jgi:hypothetical protein